MALRRPPACRAQATGVQSDTCAAVSMHLVHTALSSPSDWRLNVTGTSLVSKGNAGTTVQVSSLTTPVMRRTAQHMILRRPHAVAPERRPAGAPDERREFRISVQPRRRGPLPLPGAAALYVSLCAKMKRVHLKSIQLLEPYGQSLLEDLRYLLLSSCAAKHPEIWSRDSSGRHDCHLSLVSTCMSHTTCPHTAS